MEIRKIIRHFKTITKHRHLVFKLCCKAGIPFRGLLHDLSKYSPSEFWENAKYCNSTDRSPISYAKKELGYSKAWLHHKGRNKHHFEYWIDINAPIKCPVMPYKYTVEMICDTLAASLNYKGENWTAEGNIEYFNNRKDKEYINESLQKILLEVYQQIADQGFDKTLNKKNLKTIYDKYVN